MGPTADLGNVGRAYAPARNRTPISWSSPNHYIERYRSTSGYEFKNAFLAFETYFFFLRSEPAEMNETLYRYDLVCSTQLSDPCMRQT
jgi:hypothetical protein